MQKTKEQTSDPSVADSGIPQCIICREIFTTAEALETHERSSSHEPPKCCLCNTPFGNRWHLQRHRRACLKDKLDERRALRSLRVPEAKAFRCDVCCEEFAIYSSFQCHLDDSGHRHSASKLQPRPLWASSQINAPRSRSSPPAHRSGDALSWSPSGPIPVTNNKSPVPAVLSSSSLPTFFGTVATPAWVEDLAERARLQGQRLCEETDAAGSDTSEPDEEFNEMFSVGGVGGGVGGGLGVDLLDATVTVSLTTDTNGAPESRMDPASIDCLPMRPAHLADTQRACAVCLSDFELGEPLTALPCRHVYHLRCVKPWLVRTGTCPQCKRCVNSAT